MIGKKNVYRRDSCYCIRLTSNVFCPLLIKSIISNDNIFMNFLMQNIQSQFMDLSIVLIFLSIILNFINVIFFK